MYNIITCTINTIYIFKTKFIQVFLIELETAEKMIECHWKYIFGFYCPKIKFLI